MTEKLLLVDGTNLLFQMFFGMPARILNKDGRAIQGTVGFVGALLKIIRITVPTHIAVLFDSEGKNARQQIDEDYKANRPDYSEVPENENPFSQEADIYRALDFLGIRHTEIQGYEVDDAIASYAIRLGNNADIVISSQDSDFFQLITERVSVLRYRGDASVLCTPGYIREKLAISPSQYADFKSLVGDTADNIKGALGVGPKTAAKLLSNFSTLEEVLLNAEKIQNRKIADEISKSAEKLRNNYRIIKLENVAPTPFSLEEMEFSGLKFTTSEVLSGIGLR